MKILTFLLAVTVASTVLAQDNSLPYYEIPPTPEKYTAGNVAARVIDGLGFRFYWATEGLREADLKYKPSKDARTSEETVQHIYEMSVSIRNATTRTPNVRGQAEKVPFPEMRKRVLENLKTASDLLREASDEDVASFKIMYKSGDNVTEFPFWNHLNGPIADCIWHVGQIVSFRRASGNPFNSKASVFTGKLRE